MVGWNLVNDKLVPLQVTTKPRRLSLETISESAWTLTWWGLDEPAPAEPGITLSLKDGNLGGSSGCNSYFMEAKTDSTDLVLPDTDEEKSITKPRNYSREAIQAILKCLCLPGRPPPIGPPDPRPAYNDSFLMFAE